MKKLETFTNNPKQFCKHLKILRGKLKSSSVDAITPRQWIEHFSKFFNIKENTTVKNNLFKVRNCKCVTKFIYLLQTMKYQIKITLNRQVAIIRLVMK